MKNRFYIGILVVVLLSVVGAAAYAQTTQKIRSPYEMLNKFANLDILKRGCPVIPIFIFNYTSREEQNRFVTDPDPSTDNKLWDITPDKTTGIVPPVSPLINPTKLKQPAIIHSLVFCTDIYIRLITMPYIVKFAALMSGVLSAALVLAILVFSFKIFLGQANVKSLSMMFFLKVILVFTVIGSNPLMAAVSGFKLLGYKDTLVSAPRHLGGVIVNAVYKDNAPTLSTYNAADTVFNSVIGIVKGLPGVSDIIDKQITLPISIPLAGTISPSITITAPDMVSTGAIFQLFDKHVYSVLNIKQLVNDARNIQGTSLGVGAVIVGLLLAGDLAAMLSIVIITYMVIMVMAVAQAILFFITAQLILTVLVAIAPIVMPCLLFDKTAHITRRWFIAIIAYTLQPLLFIAFFAFVMLLIDSMVSPLNMRVPIEQFYQKSNAILSNTCTPTATDDCKQERVVKLSFESFASLFSNGNTNVRAGADPFSKGMNSYVDQIEDDINKGGVSNAIRDINNRAQNSLASVHFTKITPEKPDAKKMAEYEAKKQSFITENDVRTATTQIMVIIVLLAVLMGFLELVPEIVREMLGKVAGGSTVVVEQMVAPLKGAAGTIEHTASNIRSSVKNQQMEGQRVSDIK